MKEELERMEQATQRELDARAELEAASDLGAYGSALAGLLQEWRAAVAEKAAAEQALARAHSEVKKWTVGVG